MSAKRSGLLRLASTLIAALAAVRVRPRSAWPRTDSNSSDQGKNRSSAAGKTAQTKRGKLAPADIHLIAAAGVARLERGRFIWPSPADGVVMITPAQLGYLLEGIDWRMPQRTWRPQAAG